MAHFSIISSQGQHPVIFTGAPRYVGAYLKPGYLEFPEIGSPTAIGWHVGDYVVYSRTGRTYRLYGTPKATEQADANKYGAAFLYENVQFFDDMKQWELCPFTDLVPGDNTVHFSTQGVVSFFGKPSNVAERLQACLENQYGTGSWEVRIVDTSDADLLEILNTEVEFSVSGANCLQVLDKVYDTWNKLGWAYTIENGKNILTIGAPNDRTAANTTEGYSYGDGLVAVEKSIANATEIGTRLFAYGSMKNMDATYYRGLDIYQAESVDIEHLMIPISYWGTTSSKPDARKAYIQDASAIAKMGVIPRTAYFDGTGDLPDIHPTIERMTIGEVYDAGGAGYLPDLSKWSRNQRIDEIISANNPSDEGAASDMGVRFKESISGTLDAVTEVGQANDYIEPDIFTTTLTKSGRLALKFGRNAQTITINSAWDARFNVATLEVSNGSNLEVVPLKIVPVSSTSFTFVLPEQVVIQNAVAGTLRVGLNIFVLDNAPTAQTDTVTIGIDGTTTIEGGVVYMLNKTFSVTIPQIGFDIEKYAELGNGKKISMKTGMCAGREFEIKEVYYQSTTDRWVLTLYRSNDEDLNIIFPNADYEIAAGDQYVLLDIAMPEMYVAVASARLLAAAQNLLADICEEKPFYAPQIDAKTVVDESRVLLEGLWMDISFNGGQEYALIDSITIDENGSNIPTYDVALRQEKGLDWTENIGSASSGKSSVSVSGNESIDPKGTVTSVGLTAPEGMEVDGSPVTGAGILELKLAQGYKIPLISELVNYFEPNEGSASLIQLKPAYDYLGPRKGLVFGETAEADVEDSPAHLMLRNFGTAQNPKYALYTPFALVTGGDQIVINGEPGGGGGGGVSWLSELMDVKKNLAPSVNDILVWRNNVSRNDGTTAPGWTNMTKSTFLSGYATQTWVGQQITALNLGAASTYGIGQVASGDNGLVTGGSVFSYVTGVLSSVLKFQGTTTTAISDGSTTNPITINGASYTAQKGDVVLYDGKEYLWQGSSWEQLGDESSWALKTTKIQAGTGLTGGGTLAANRTISLSSASIASLALADTAYQKPSTGIPATDLASAVQTNITNGATAYGYFTNGVANSAARLSGNTAYSVWGVEFWANGVPKSATAQPNLYVGNTKVATSAQTAMSIGGLGTLTLANGSGIRFADNPAEGATAQNLTALQFTTTNKLLIGFNTSTAGAETILYGNEITLRYGTGHTNGMIINSTAITAYRDIIPSSSGSRNLGSSTAFWKYAYAQRLYLTSSIYIEYVDNSGNGYVHINAPLVTDGDQIVVSGTPGGGGSGGVNWLYELQDVDPTLSNPTGGMVLQYDATSHLWKGVASDTIGITTSGTVAELNAATPTTAKRVWSPSVLASWLAGKNYITGADAVSNVAVGGSGHTDELAITKNGTTTYLTIPYATTAKRFKRYEGTNESGGYNLNTLLTSGGITSQYSSSNHWANGPTNMTFGGALQVNPQVSNLLAMQFAWDVVHQATQGNYGTGKLWWRDATYHDGAADWGAWHIIYDNTTLLLNGAAGSDAALTFYAPTSAGTADQVLLSGGAGVAPRWVNQGTIAAGRATNDGNGDEIAATYLKLSGGTMTGDITLPSGKYIRLNANTAMLGLSSGGVFYCGPGDSATSFLLRSGNINLVHRKYTAASTYTDYAIWDGSNTTISQNALTLGSATLGTSSTPIGYATQSRRPWAVAGTQEAGGFDLNTVLARGGAIRNINSSTFWAHAPSGATYFGIAYQINPTATEVGAMQFYWDGAYTGATPTGGLWWRLRNDTGWADDWHRIYDSANANLSTVDWACNDLNAAGKVNVGAPSFSDGALNVNGAIVSAGDQVVTSDIRVKRNLKPIELTVEQIAACRAVTFDWGTGGHSFGSIAQDWEPILPEAVKDGGVKALAYGQLALVAAINIASHETEQDKEIRQLRKRVVDLENEVKRLRTS